MPSRVVFTASDGFVLMSQTNLKYFIAFQFLTANVWQRSAYSVGLLFVIGNQFIMKFCT